ncbi:formyltetrahydrofolate deformylase [Labedella gwakjiensis]|uniref:Formyltetrahydrofolate deformylase n=1 Tax=Labedella gwakjiensis TaxID=390269 RepID=A0A2P8GRS0_9MICO|nr:formyltetrahydrofolate deformylase [Labedella gwakjiensis]
MAFTRLVAMRPLEFVCAPMCAPRAGGNHRPLAVYRPAWQYPRTVTDAIPTLNHWVLTIVCPDRPGIVHAVSGAVVEASGNITESQQFSSADTGRFFMRLQVESAADRETFRTALEPIAERYTMEWRLDVVGRPLKTLVLASTAAHCLNDLLFRQRAGQLAVDIPLVLANHGSLRDLAQFYGVPFESAPVTNAEQKAAFERRIIEAVEEHDIELVVLARYMQILSPKLCERLAGRAINIHHSFLPGFKGANPYRQAHARGVKLIGATAHFVTSDLDEGPIIEQNVVRVDHSRSASELVAIGQDEESRTLTQAVKWFSEDRVLLDGARTIIFR